MPRTTRTTGSMRSKRTADRTRIVRRCPLPLVVAWTGVLLVGSPLAAQVVSTAEGGRWDDSLTWEGRRLPGPGDDVVIRGPVTHPGSCRSLTVEAGASLVAPSGRGIAIGGDVVNRGTVAAGAGARFMVDIGGDLSNEGTWEPTDTRFTEGRHVLSFADGTALGGDVGATGHDVVLELAGPLRLTGRMASSRARIVFAGSGAGGAAAGAEAPGRNYIIIMDSRVQTPSPDHLIVLDGGRLDGIPIEGDVTVRGTPDGSGELAGHVTGDLFLEGSVRLGHTRVDGDLVLTGTVTNRAGPANVTVAGSILNRGDLRTHPESEDLAVRLGGDLVSEGSWSPGETYFEEGVHALRMATGGSLGGSVRGSSRGVTLRAASPLAFDGPVRITDLDMAGHRLSIRGPLSAGVRSATTIAGAGAAELTRVTVEGDARLEGPLKVRRLTVSGDLVTDAELVNAASYSSLAVQGSLTNGGRIGLDPEGGPFDIKIAAALDNRGWIDERLLPRVPLEDPTGGRRTPTPAAPEDTGVAGRRGIPAPPGGEADPAPAGEPRPRPTPGANRPRMPDSVPADLATQERLAWSDSVPSSLTIASNRTHTFTFRARGGSGRIGFCYSVSDHAAAFGWTSSQGVLEPPPCDPWLTEVQPTAGEEQPGVNPLGRAPRSPGGAEGDTEEVPDSPGEAVKVLEFRGLEDGPLFGETTLTLTAIDEAGATIERSIRITLQPELADDALGDLGRQVEEGRRLTRSPVWGIADTHAHQFTHLGFGGMLFHGRAFHPSGQSAALPWCDAVHGPGGAGDLLGNYLTADHTHRGISGHLGHLVGGNPQFDGWPRWDSYTHQQMYVDWLKRAVDGGLRLMVMRAVNSEVLCGVVNRRFGCQDMPAVERQIQRAWELQDHVDQRSGGTGEGWYRIVRSPAEARAVIEEGKLAVVLGVEVADLFNCNEVPCDRPMVRDRLKGLYDLGVRDITPIHQLDNAFGGTALYNQIFNFGNLVVHGELYQIRDCSPTAEGGYQFKFGFSDPQDLAGPPLELLRMILGDQFDEIPILPADMGAHCNVRGLTGLGRFLIQEMMSRKMLIDVDHMSARSVDETLDLAETHGYPVLGSHTGIQGVSRGEKNSEGQKTDEQLDRIYGLGGFVSIVPVQGDREQISTHTRPGGGTISHRCGYSAESWAQPYLYTADRMGRPVGIGSDFNGFAGMPAPRFPGDEHSEACNGDGSALSGTRVVYPFRTHGASPTTMGRTAVGQKVFDINVDGLAHVGMLPDFVEELKRIGLGDADLEPLFSSADAYLAMWERIAETGVPPPSAHDAVPATRR